LNTLSVEMLRLIVKTKNCLVDTIKYDNYVTIVLIYYKIKE